MWLSGWYFWWCTFLPSLGKIFWFKFEIEGFESEFCMEHLHTCSATHFARKRAQFPRSIPIWAAEVGLRWGPVLAQSLATQSTPRVVSLVSIVILNACVWSRGFRKWPPWEIKSIWWVRWCLGHVAPRSHCSRCRCQIFKTASFAALSKSMLRILWLWMGTKSILGSFGNIGSVFIEILGTWVCVVMSSGHSRLSSNLGCADSRPSAVVGLDWVI